MDPDTKKVVVSRDVIFDEVSPYQEHANTDNTSTSLGSLFGDACANEKEGNLPPSEVNIQQNDSMEPVTRMSSRHRRQPEYLADYEVQLNHCSVLSCFLLGDAYGNEPRSFNEAKDSVEWREAMVEEIAALHKNGTWELVPKPKDVELVTCK